MTQPSVNITELDGSVGILPPTSGGLLALLGTSSSGPLDTPATYARIKDVVATFGAGPLVEAAAHAIEVYGRPVVLVRTGQTTAGATSAVTSVATGTSVVTIASPTAVYDDWDLYLKIITGGTRGTAGVTFQWSLDGGRTLSPITDLGTAIEFVFPGAGGVKMAFAAGTFVAGDVHTARCTAPQANATELGTAIDALKNTAIFWETLHVVTPISATLFDTIETAFASLLTNHKPRWWIGSVRIPAIGETEATYLSSLVSAFSAKATKMGALCAGAVELTSSVSRRKYLRPISFVVAAREASLSEEQNSADVNLGPLSGVSIKDANGNPKHHDESINPGLDDARFTVLRTHVGLAGIYVNRPRLFSPEGSDFRLVPHRRVLNIAHVALYTYFLRRLNKPVRVNPTTGFILEEEALEIEAGARAVLAAVLLARPKASGATFTLSRTDNLLSTFTLTGQARVVPLAYPETITLDLGFTNPALQVQAAA